MLWVMRKYWRKIENINCCNGSRMGNTMNQKKRLWVAYHCETLLQQNGLGNDQFIGLYTVGRKSLIQLQRQTSWERTRREGAKNMKITQSTQDRSSKLRGNNRCHDDCSCCHGGEGRWLWGLMGEESCKEIRERLLKHTEQTAQRD